MSTQKKSVAQTTNELVLLLICEELKTCKFFNTMTELGFDYSYYRPDLSSLILSLTGLSDDTNETFDFYYNEMERNSLNLEPDEESIRHHANQVLAQLTFWRDTHK